MLKVIILLLCVNCNSVIAQNQIFKKLKGDNIYQLYIRRSPSVIVEKDDKIEQILITDQEQIKKIIATWKGKKINGYFKCGYNSFVSLVSNGKVVEEFLINDQCKQVVNKNDEAFNFQEDPFKNLTSNLAFSSCTITCKSKAEVEKFIISVSKMKNIYCWNADDIIENDSKYYQVFIYGSEEMIQKIKP